MQLYTVILKQPHMVSRFDDKGVKIEDKTVFVDQIIRDLPAATARMYRDTSEAGHCQVIKQAESAPTSRRHDVRFGDVKTGKSQRQEPTRTQRQSKPVKDKIAEAASKGDMAAAINAGEAA